MATQFARRALAVLVLTMALAGCGGDGGTGPSVPPAVAIGGGVSQGLVSGATLQLSATVTDAKGKVVASPAITWTSSDPAVAAVTPGGLVSATLAGSATVTATAIGASGSVTIAVSPGAPARLTIKTQPTGAAAGAVLGTSPVIELRDAAGNLAAATSVSAAIGSGGGALSGTTTVASSAGIATFTNLVVSGIVGPRTLVFTSVTGTASTVQSDAFPLEPGLPAVLALRAVPAGAGLNTPFTTQPIVEVRDASANVVTASAALVTAVISTGGGTLSGASATAVQGVATFAGMRISGNPGARTLAFGSTGLPSITASAQPCDPTRAPQVEVGSASRAYSAYTGGEAATDSLGILERNGSCTAMAGLFAAVTFPATSGWLLASISAQGPALVLRTAPSALGSGQYAATVTVGSSNAGSATLPVSFTVRPSWSLTFGSASEKVNVIDLAATLRVPVTVRDSVNAVVVVPVSYIARAPSIVTVASDGLMTGRADGQGWVVGRVSGNGDPVDSVFVNVTRGPGPVLRTDLTRLTYARNENFSVVVELDTRGASIGAAEVVFTWPSISDFPGMLRLSGVVPGPSGAPTITTNTTSGSARISIASATALTGVVRLARFDFAAAALGVGQFATRVVDLIAPDQASLVANASALQYPVVVR